MSTLAVSRTLITMDTENARITRKEAAALARVSTRQISRWSAAGLLNPEYGPPETGSYATYDPEEVLRAKREWASRVITGSSRARQVQ